jgi:alpha-methylacyl-CoA racemase
MRMAIAARMKEKTIAEWTSLFEGSDACVAPVLSLGEAPNHPHARARRSHVPVGALSRPAPAPRLSRTPAHVSRLRERMAVETLERYGLGEDEVRSVIDRGIVA